MEHPRYQGPIIDSHTHADGTNLNLVQEIGSRNGVAAMVNLWNGKLPPPAFDDWVEEVGEHKWRETGPTGYDTAGVGETNFLLHHTPDLARIAEPDFASFISDDVRAAATAGASGIKVWKNLGLGIKDERGELVAVDDPRLDPLWRTAGESGLPVSIHVADPVAFFEPLTPDNERYEELSLHPEWWFGGEEFPTFDEIMGQLENIVARHQSTTFIGLHLGCYAENLDFVGHMLDSYPNYMVDTAARIAEFGRHGAARVREFFVTYADRILFGTDLARTRSLWLPEDRFYERELGGFYDLHWRYFETAEKEMAHPFPEQGSWTVDGIDLPDEVLGQLYYQNAIRTIPGLERVRRETEDTHRGYVEPGATPRDVRE